LRDALQEGLSISSAISRARESLSSDTDVLAGALGTFELERADAAMEGALALRPVERAVSEVLLPTLDDLAERNGPDSAPWAFAARWAIDWLSRAQRLAPPPVRRAGILIGDATRDDLDPDAIALRALQLFVARGGVRVLALPVAGVLGLAEVLTAFGPTAGVIAGAHAGDDVVARWAYGVRSASGALPIAVFRRGQRAGRAQGRALPRIPGDACDHLMGILDARGRQALPTENHEVMADLTPGRQHGVGA